MPSREVIVMTSRSGWILALACVPMVAGPTRSRAQDVPAGKPDAKAVKSMVEEAADWYRVFADASAPGPMTPHRVLRWRNVTRGTQESEGLFILWVNKGRPEASASVYPWSGDLYHSFVSLSPGTTMVAREGSRVIWSPEAPGVEFRDIPGAPVPAGNPAARLKQMKALVDRFKVTMTGWKPDKSDREDLRLLPKPLYRYETNEATGPDAGWIDGEVLAFVSGTDPEALLLLEATRQGGRPRWRYAFARATAAGLEAKLDQAVVWEVGFLEGAPTPRQPQMTLSRPLSATAAGNGAAPAGP
jgi:hypothetical protein